MPSNADTHPEPDEPKSTPAPKFPLGAGGIKNVTPPRPGIIHPDDPSPAPARDPFPDHLPDSGVSRH